MNYKKIALAFLSCIYILIFFNIEQYKTWLEDRILVFSSEIYDHLDRMDLEERRRFRWSNTYTDALTIKEYLDTSGIKEPLLMLPPLELVKKNLPNAIIPEPIVFYYFTGVKTILPDSRFIDKANVALVLRGNGLTIEKIENKEQLQAILNLYK
jgi:hypothetical protein